MSKINKSLILKVARAIERDIVPGLSFDMSNYRSHDHHGCGTTGCIAGYTIAVGMGMVVLKKMALLQIKETAAEELGLTDDQTDALFRGDDSCGELKAVTPTQAAATLRRFAETGIVEWKETV